MLSARDAATSEIVHVIHLGFPVRPRPRASELLPGHGLCWEHLEVRAGLKHRNWQVVSRAFVRHWRNGLMWLTPIGFGYYLPAWLSLACVDGDTREPVIFSLEDYPSWIQQGIADDRRDRLDRPRLAAIVAFLEHWATHGDMLGSEAEYARRAIDRYWGARLAAASPG